MLDPSKSLVCLYKKPTQDLSRVLRMLDKHGEPVTSFVSDGHYIKFRAFNSSVDCVDKPYIRCIKMANAVYGFVIAKHT